MITVPFASSHTSSNDRSPSITVNSGRENRAVSGIAADRRAISTSAAARSCGRRAIDTARCVTLAELIDDPVELAGDDRPADRIEHAVDRHHPVERLGCVQMRTVGLPVGRGVVEPERGIGSMAPVAQRSAARAGGADP